MTSHTAILSELLHRADIIRQIERFVEAVRSSSEPAYRVLHDDSGQALYLPTPLAIPTTQLKLMHDFIMGLEGHVGGEALLAFRHASRCVGLEFSPMVGMVCLSEDESRYLCSEESLNWFVRNVRVHLIALQE
ncbi:hypothetical protein [Pseudomonas aeruginosa]|uniref:hypothetical protein n=1 Tax=Pseudomonas aeruginosa TaxID=287 RepID=UPI0007724D8C|nr:hypothetical protein [Pseudomonas aeruginosa]KXE04916.1 hypothetical protein AW917_14025 [Pseudomonas aeruginosa]KXE06713.1 hypothetical protein AW918_13490 [Pseudomonas aeruginosa]KXE18993.1 hypothetical protein AW920_13725 [Pseudomonas aeruginosa]KXE20575.1 hypothetical protein AW919_14180 [Pseudomonas aeruginosa]KXE30315.1 hypothetical protein AW921_14160 [Pseudomonas aeruginosa]